jgi:B9 domain-containing protein 1
VISGVKSGVTQCASVEADYRRMIFNMPIEISLKSTNPYGWPQIVYSLYGTNFWGVETSRGYARIHCPLPGNAQTIKAPIFIPKFTSFWSALMSWITDINPEMKDPKMMSDGSKHKGLYSEAYGELVTKLQVLSRGCGKMSLDWGQTSGAQ